MYYTTKHMHRCLIHVRSNLKLIELPLNIVQIEKYFVCIVSWCKSKQQRGEKELIQNIKNKDHPNIYTEKCLLTTRLYYTCFRNRFHCSTPPRLTMTSLHQPAALMSACRLGPRTHAHATENFLEIKAADSLSGTGPPRHCFTQTYPLPIAKCVIHAYHSSTIRNKILLK